MFQPKFHNKNTRGIDVEQILDALNTNIQVFPNMTPDFYPIQYPLRI